MFKASVKEIGPMSVAFAEMHGPYAQMPEGFGRLYGWLGQRGLQPIGMPAAVFLTAPDQVPEEEAVWELWAPVAGEHKELACDESGCGIKAVGPLRVASTMHKGPYEECVTAYDGLARWILDNGYAIVGPPMELYLTDPKDVPPSEYLTEIQFPVA